MSTYLQFSIPGRSVGRGKGALHRMAYGSRAITPKNLSQMLLSMVSQSGGHSGAGGSGDGSKAPMVIVKEVDSASPLLWQASCTNETIPSVDLTFFRPTGAGGKEQVVSRITLTNAVISKINQFRPSLFLPPKKPKLGNSTGHKDTNELEQFQLVFQKIAYTSVSGKKSASDDWTA